MTLLFDAPPGYSESPHPTSGGLYCDQCPDQRDVTQEPCPVHGPASTIDRRIDYPRLAELAELVMRHRDLDSAAFQQAVAYRPGLNPTHLPLLEQWGVIGRTTTKTDHGMRVPIIHTAHADIVQAQITEQHGDPTSGTLSYLAMPAFSARFRRIIDLTAEGTSNAGMARQLGLTTETIKTYTAQIRAQLRAVDRAHMVHRAHLLGLFGAIPQQPGGQR